MSVIVIVRKNNQSVIASDGLNSLGSMKLHADNHAHSSKLIKTPGSIIGIAGWSALHDIVTHLSKKKPELFTFSSREDLFDKALDIHQELEDNYFINTSEDSDQPVDSSQIHLLIATTDGIFELESYRAVVEYKKFFAIGAGSRFALGAMHAVYDSLEDPVEIAKAGIEAGCYFSDSCDHPIYIEKPTLENKQE